MSRVSGSVIGVNGNMITVHIDGHVTLNEVGYACVGDERLKSEVIRVHGDQAELQVFEMTQGLSVGDRVEFTGDLLAVELGPGLLGQVYDGLQNPLPELAEKCGFFLQRGMYLKALSREKEWEWTPDVSVGDVVVRGDLLGMVPEGHIAHRIMVPFSAYDTYTVKEVMPKGSYKVDDTVVVATDSHGADHRFSMRFEWAIKRPVDVYEERLLPEEPLKTNLRIIDSFYPISLGGTFCIPGPFGAGKTVLQQSMSRNAMVDIVIVAACGERAGEVVDTLREFPELIDPQTGKSLMERTIIICNTSSMPVAAREASVYTAVTLAEYYRQMGLNVLLLADSTSRWAQAMREMSGRLEEIPGEEAFPAYLESVIAAFYERAGLVRLKDGSYGSVTIGGTVSPAGGNFEEPVTQATLKVVGAFLGLSRERSDARKYPAIHPLESWSKYATALDIPMVEYGRELLFRGDEIAQMMKVVGESGTGASEYDIYLKADCLDSVYLQQDGFDEVDASCSIDRQREVFDLIFPLLISTYAFEDKDQARKFFNGMRQMFLDLNFIPYQSDEYHEKVACIKKEIEAKKTGEDPRGARILRAARNHEGDRA